MSLADQGGYDIVIEVAQSAVLDFASSIPFPAPSVPFSTTGTYGVAGTFQPSVGVDGVSFPDGDSINPSATEMDVSVSLTGSTITLSSVPFYGPSVPTDLKTITLEGDIVFPSTLSVSGLAVVASFANQANAVVSDDLFNSLLAAPAITLLLAAALQGDPTGATYAQAKLQLQQSLQQLVQSFANTLPAITLLDATGMSSSLQASPAGRGIAAIDFLLGDQSIFLLLTVGGPGGSKSTLTRSNLQRNTAGAPTDLVAIVINNQCVMRDLVEPTLESSSSLGLPASGFLPARFEPALAWAGNTALTAAETTAIPQVNATVVLGGIDGVNIDFFLLGNANGIGGTFSVDPFTVAVSFGLSASSSSNSITLTISPVGSPTVTSSVSIAWWVYVGSFIIGGLDLVALTAIANAFASNVADSIVEGKLGAVLPGATTFSLPLPPGSPPLSVRATSLRQPDAPTANFGSGFLSGIFPWRLNDVVINLH
jgi:hypothetical protein